MNRAGFIAAAALFLFSTLHAGAETLRIATYNTELSQKGPGLLLQALERQTLPDVERGFAALAELQPDILVLQNIDWDAEHRALKAIQLQLQVLGLKLSHSFTAKPNSGLSTGVDMDGDGRKGGPRDAQGYGLFTGAHAMAVLSRYPLRADALTDFTDHLWADFPWSELPVYPDGSPFPSAEAQTAQRLSSTNHWILPVSLPGEKQIDLMLFHATPPVFDGGEDRNGKRNQDEILLWHHVLLTRQSSAPVLIAGSANLDPERGEGRREAITKLLAHPQLQDPRPKSKNGNTETVIWPSIGPRRVDYILPDSRLHVLGSGVIWPTRPDTPRNGRKTGASRHAIVWVDLVWP